MRRSARSNGVYAANRVLALLRAMFNKAGDMGFNGVNPAIGVQRFPEEKRDRFLEADELPSFFKALLADPNATFRDFFLLGILTGARRGNVQSDGMGGRGPKRGLLADSLDKVRGSRGRAVGSRGRGHSDRSPEKHQRRSPWVFPSKGRTGHIMDPKAASAQLLAAAGLSDLRFHDLRRSLGSWQAMGGAEPACHRQEFGPHPSADDNGLREAGTRPRSRFRGVGH